MEVLVRIMTEDDTFRRLRQTPFLDVARDWSRSPIMVSDPGRDEFFDKHGWTWEEYIVEYYIADKAGLLLNLFHYD